MADPIPIEEATRRVLAEVLPPAAERVPLARALDRVLAEDVAAAVDVPPFDSSAMDGYAVGRGAEGRLVVAGEARAGHPASEGPGPDSAVRISTGAAVPRGTYAVIPIERVTENGDAVTVPAAAEGANIRLAGEDMRAGDTVLRAGTHLGPAAVGVLAGAGRGEVDCGPRPRVAILATGDELTPPGEPLAPGRIWSSNPLALAGQVDRAGGEVVLSEPVPDEPAATLEALRLALDAADVVCVSGGVSVGPHDHVKEALGALGVEERFWGVALRPGKPTWFGVRGRTLVFGLPGNPVSAMVTFHLFARPALRALQGADPSASRAEALVAEAFPRNPRRTEAVRCRLETAEGGWRARPTGPQGSHVLSSMLHADALAIIPPGEGEVAPGGRVEVELLRTPGVSSGT